MDDNIKTYFVLIGICLILIISVIAEYNKYKDNPGNYISYDDLMKKRCTQLCNSHSSDFLWVKEGFRSNDVCACQDKLTKEINTYFIG